MGPEHILRIPRSDSEGEYVVVSVTTNGSSPLDLRVVGTEGESPYVTISESGFIVVTAQTDH